MCVFVCVHAILYVCEHVCSIARTLNCSAVLAQTNSATCICVRIRICVCISCVCVPVCGVARKADSFLHTHIYSCAGTLQRLRCPPPPPSLLFQLTRGTIYIIHACTPPAHQNVRPPVCAQCGRAPSAKDHITSELVSLKCVYVCMCVCVCVCV